MKDYNKHNLNVRSMPIICLCLIMLFVQTFKVHVHVEHLNSLPDSVHMTEVHFDSSSHKHYHGGHDQLDFESTHPPHLDVNPTGTIVKLDLIKISLTFVLLLLIVFLIPWIKNSFRLYVVKETIVSRFFLLFPPLRAPPL